MKYLLDVNCLIALGHQDHADHDRASRWFSALDGAADSILTCAISELGFVRVSVQAGLSDDVASAQDTLAGMATSSRIPFVLVGDSLGVAVMPSYVKTPKQLTDGHLLALAAAHGARLATLDDGIPGARRIE